MRVDRRRLSEARGALLDEVKLLERDIERTCSELLELDGWRSLKTDPVSRREWGKGFGERGMADRLYIRYGVPDHSHDLYCRDGCVCAQVMWIEWKRPRGKSATKAAQHQKDWHAAERARGALTLIAGEDFPATIEGFAEWYRNSGLMRRALLLTGGRSVRQHPS